MSLLRGVWHCHRREGEAKERKKKRKQKTKPSTGTSSDTDVDSDTSTGMVVIIRTRLLASGLRVLCPSLHCTYLWFNRTALSNHSGAPSFLSRCPGCPPSHMVQATDHSTSRYPGQPYISLPYIHLQRHSSASHPGKPRTHAAAATARATAPSSSSGCVAVSSVDT
ncbi:hypothetical protein BGZ61DRAFT_470896 [Ilyonectria robusta]|uniref:uncharacterized protein n=1 Tax=Ilyonectria robusta TaxID=1079257 RepID=UPI001E8E736C|nr:uncharacterized protein BGZ61DRAFT_470896 [Ilyonectria robusta]KAH8737458.1 hypothetical protein BGZ61DRAFT_470896 [Ilyonectria robusta]